MSLLAPLLTVSLLATTGSSPQLLIKESSASGQCSEVLAESAQPMREALAADIAEDLRRYFGGRSVQVTPILEAAWHGRVLFCTREAEDHVDRVLSELVVRSSNGVPPGGSELPTGAESLLTALASDVLAAELEGTATNGSQEAERKKQALAIVRGKTTVSTPAEDVVVALDTDLPDKVGVHLGHHAAVYYLLRDDRELAARLKCARESLANGTRIRFTYAVAGQVITSFECIHPPTP